MTLRHIDTVIVHEKVHTEHIRIVSTQQLELPRPDGEILIPIQHTYIPYEAFTVLAKVDLPPIPPVLPEYAQSVCSKQVPTPRSRSPGIRGIFLHTHNQLLSLSPTAHPSTCAPGR